MPYSGDPSASDVDAVRFWLQDTGAAPLLSDAELQYVITYVNVDTTAYPAGVAAVAADMIAAKYAGEVSINSDGVNYSGDQLQQKYTALAAQLRKTDAQQRARTAAPYVGGVLASEIPMTGVRQPQFGIGMFDNPENTVQEYGYTGEFDASEPPDRIGG